MRKLILFGIVSLLTIQANSQSISSVVEDFNRTGDIYTQRTVIDNNITYILSQNGTNSEIYKVNSSQVAVLPSNIQVKDFAIFGTQLFFCGVSSGLGFIARANLNDFFTNNEYYFTYVRGAISIDKMLLDTYSGTYNLACIGIDNTGVSMFVHCQLNSTMIEIFKTTIQNEVFDDLILQGQDIIIVGRDPNYASDFIIRGFDRYNYSQTFYDRYDNGTGWSYTNRLLATPLNGNSIAIVGEGEDGGDNLITLASFVDLNNAIPHFTKWFGSDKYKGNNGEFARIKDIMFSTADNKLLILEEYPYSFTAPSPFTQLITSIMVLDIVQSLTNRDAIYSYIQGIDHKYNNLIEKDPYVFLATGINPSNNQVELWEGNRSIMGGNCNLIRPYELNDVTIQPSFHFYLYLEDWYNFEWIRGTNSIISVNKTILCN
ncbi:MAG: hypothetical protein H6Q15_1558 [Bacteroidetes bacterium]|nr:hypothetical protein [Bacteroidota bacterium]